MSAVEQFAPIVLPYTLHDFQQAFREDVRRAVRDEPAGGAHLYSSPTGSGKSLMGLAVLEDDPEAFLITPRLEIVAGMLDKLGAEGVSEWSDQKLANVALSYRISTPVRFLNMLAAGTAPIHPARIIQDECFPAGTLVDGRPIETIQVGDHVTAFDEKTGRAVRRMVTRRFVNPAPAAMVEIEFVGRTVRATPSHPIYTQRGWANAEGLRPGDGVLLRVREGVPAHQSEPGSRDERLETVLRADLHEGGNSGAQVGRDDANEPGARVGANEGAEPDGAGRRSSEAVGDVTCDGPRAADTSGERARVDGLRTDPRGPNGARPRGRADGIEGQGLPDALQARPRRADAETGDRDRRAITQHVIAEGAGQEERGVLTWVRVDRVTVLQRGSDAHYDEVCPDGRVYNLEVAGEHTYFANDIVVHNCHHSEADTYQKIRAYLPGVTRIGLTATPYRGTPKSTAALLADWGDRITQVLSLPQAAERGIIEVPEVELWPLVDDDTIAVVNGELRATASADVLRPRLAEVVERCRKMVERAVRIDAETLEPIERTRTVWDRPTLFAVPATDTVADLVERLNAAGLPAVGVTQDTPRAERNEAFRRVVAREVAVVQIDVVSEGVDLPIRRLVDLRPTMSPVRWMQQLGRITRPRKGDAPRSVYICANRNLERHGYLMGGLFPAQKIGQAQKMFPTPSARGGQRAVGLEGVGRFQSAELHLMDGTVAQMYALYATVGFERHDYAVILHPAVEKPLVATRTSAKNDDGTLAWGRWARIDEVPADLRGFSSSPPKAISDKQAAWWAKAAIRHGLDPAEKPTRKTFAALPVLADVKASLRVGGF